MCGNQYIAQCPIGEILSQGIIMILEYDVMYVPVQMMLECD